MTIDVQQAALFYRSEAWTKNKRETPPPRKMNAAQMRILSPLIWLKIMDLQNNSNIRNKLKTNNMVEEFKANQKKKNCLDQAKRTNTIRLQRLALQ